MGAGEPAAHPDGREGSWYPELLQECCQQAAQHSPLLSAGEATPGGLAPVLHSPVQKNPWSYWRVGPRATKVMKGLEHFSCEGWERLGLEKRAFVGSSPMYMNI